MRKSMRPERPCPERVDRYFDDQGFNDSGLKTRPSELFKQLLDLV
jgi:hypothetical protein